MMFSVSAVRERGREAGEVRAERGGEEGNVRQCSLEIVAKIEGGRRVPVLVPLCTRWPLLVSFWRGIEH